MCSGGYELLACFVVVDIYESELKDLTEDTITFRLPSWNRTLTSFSADQQVKSNELDPLEEQVRAGSFARSLP